MTNPTHVLITFQKPKAVESNEGDEVVLTEVPDWREGIAVHGPSAISTCEAAAAHLDHETTGFVVTELKPLDVPQSELSKHLDEQAAQRAAWAEELRNG